MAKAKAKALPKTLFAKFDGEPGDGFYNADPKIENLLESSGTAIIGKYKLVAVRRGSLVPKFED